MALDKVGQNTTWVDRERSSNISGFPRAPRTRQALEPELPNSRSWPLQRLRGGEAPY
jgi:hypothetical protein